MIGHRINGLPWHELFYKMLNLCAELTQSSNSGQFLLFIMIGQRGNGLPWHELFYKMLNLCAELTQSSNSGQFFV
jgi:hypothetical protein